MDLKVLPGSSEVGSDYPSELYAALHRGTKGDVDFYLRACSGAESVLELGCGHGRILGPLARAGHQVFGLERDPVFATKARRVVAPFGGEVIVGDMTDFDLGRRFDRVILPFNGLYCLLDPESVARCFACVRRHLEADGLFVFDGYVADAFHIVARPEDLAEDHLEPLGVVHTPERAYEVFERTRWIRETQRIEATYLYVACDGSPTVTCQLPQRYLLHDETFALLEAAGLEPWAVHGDFDQRVFDEFSNLRIVTSRLKGG